MSATWPVWRIASDPPLELAETLARKVRRQLLGAARAGDPLPDLGPLATAAGATVAHADLNAARSGLQALLAPRAGGFDIYVDPSVDLQVDEPSAAVSNDLERHRARFRIAHELAHTFFYDRAGQAPTRLLGDTDRQEAFCDRFAAALLLPREAVRVAGCRPAAIIAVQHRYDVSLQLAVRRFAEVFPERTFVLMAETGRHPPRLRAQWAHCPRPLRARWWASQWLQGALQHGVEVRGRLPAENGSLLVEGVALPERRQLLLSESFAATVVCA